MAGNIGEVNYNDFSVQKYETWQATEKSINSLFQRNVISEGQRDKLFQMYFSGEISFGKDGLTAEEALNFTQETFSEIEQNLSSSQQNKTRTPYIIQPGDTPEIISEKLGLTGAEARNFATKIKAQAIKDGMYYRYGFKSGDMIALPGDFQEQINAMIEDGSYATSAQDINSTYRKIRKAKAAKAKAKSASPKQQTKVNPGDENAANKLKQDATNIVTALKKNGASPKNTVLNNINSKNVTFVLSIYNQNTGRSLAKDLINNGDKGLSIIKNKICWHLAKRAQELKLNGIYYGDYMNIKDANKLLEWINNAQSKLFEAEKRQNPAINDVLTNKKYIQTQKNTKDIKNNSKKLASDLYKQISGLSNSDNTKQLLNQITAGNAAFVVSEYKNLTKNSLAKDINDEYGLDINDVKTYICKKLVAQAKNIGLTGIYYSNYMKTYDIGELDEWIDKTAQKIRAAMELNNNSTAQTSSPTDSAKETLNNPIYKQAGVKSLVYRRDKSGKIIETVYYYNDGKVVKEFQDPKRGRVRELVKQGDTPNSENSRITEAVPIQISLPSDASENAKEFAKALEVHKQDLMAKLGLDNDTYNKLAKLAMAIAEQETNFGNNGGMYRSGKYEAGRVLPDTPLHDWSYGPTQIKFEMQKRDEWIADKFKKLGLTEGSQLYDMENAALATMVVLAQNNRIIKNNKNYQKGIEAARDSIVTIDGWEMKNGHLEKTYNTRPFVNKVTDEDALCYFWNGRGASIKDGTMEPEALEYTRNIHKYLEKYNIKEDSAKRNQAVRKSQDKRIIQNFKPMDNNGPLGSIAFMPGMYGYTDLKDQSDELAVLKESLKKNKKIEQNSKQLLILAVQHGEIGFEFGLTAQEADSLTQKDVDMILSHISKLKNVIKSKDSSINFADGINSSESDKMKNNYAQIIKDAEFLFKKEYLASKSPHVALGNVPEKNLLASPMDNDMTYSRKSAIRRGFAGNIYDKIPDEGVNTTNTSQASSVLAKYAQNTAKQMNTSGYCMTGFRDAIRKAGIDDSDLKESKPRATVGWFERHPEMFEEVKYIKSGNSARQINSSDLPNLPAGYIVVWIPDNKYKAEEPGHISITNGNGQAYADETDNLDWGVYHGRKNVGKGEHGNFRVFRLTDNWKVENGKLKFCK